MMKIRPSGISTSAVKSFRMSISLVRGDCRARRAPTRSRSYDRNTRDRNALRTGIGRPAFPVQALAHFLAGLEERHALLVDRHMRAGARIAAGAGGAMLHRERTETAQLDPVAAGQRGDDLIENRVHDVLDIPLIEMRVVLGDTLNEFGFDHRDWDPELGNIHFRENALNCQDAK